MRKLICGLLLILTLPLQCAPIEISDCRDYCILDQFFREMTEDELFGYVLEDVKPLSVLNIFPSYVHDPDVLGFQGNVVAEEAIEVWNRLAPKQKDYVLKAVPRRDHRIGGPYYELSFISRKKLHETVLQNLNLFRLVVSPALDAPGLSSCIADSPQPLDTIVKSNNALIGILLGYGTHNSLMGGRLEDLMGAFGDHDQPPFASRDRVQEIGRSFDWKRYHYSLAYTGQEVIPETVARYRMIQPGAGFPSFQNEIAAIESSCEQLPDDLECKAPRFIFGPYRGDSESNQQLFKRAQVAQTKIQTLLKRDDFLEYVLEKITGEKPIIKCPRNHAQKILLEIEAPAETSLAAMLWDKTQQLDEEMVPAFMDGFRQHPSTQQMRRGPLPGVYKGLKEAQANLRVADAQFAAWSKNRALKVIVPEGICFERLKEGHGRAVGADGDLLLSYVIEDGLGHTLSASHKCWITLSQVLPGFAHGMKGMQEGESRKIYIHPAYGYGAITTLTPCTSLVVTVTLHQIDEPNGHALPALAPLDLAWVKDAALFEKVRGNSRQAAYDWGRVWGEWLSQSPDIDFDQLCAQLEHLVAQQEIPMPTRETRRLCNRVFSIT